MKRILILLLTVTTIAQVSAECSTNRCRRHKDRHYGPVTTVVSPVTEPLHIYPVTDVATRPADVLLGDGWLYHRQDNQ